MSGMVYNSNCNGHMSIIKLKGVKDMPGRDGTGPIGAGAMTGRGFGPCANPNAARGGANYGLGYGANYGMGLGARARFGCGLGFGRGRGFNSNYGAGFGRNFAYSELNQKASIDQKDLLIEQKELLESRLDEISKQLEDL